jgi:Fe2+ transport system protein B
MKPSRGILLPDNAPVNRCPDLLVCVVGCHQSSSLTLRLVLEARALGLPMVLALNMSRRRAVRAGIVINRDVLSKELGMPVLETVGIRARWCAQELTGFSGPGRPRRYCRPSDRTCLLTSKWQAPGL